MISIMHTTDVVVPFMEPLDRQILDPSVSPNMKPVTQYGVGPEGVDMRAPTKSGVVVSNIPAADSGNAISTVEISQLSFNCHF